MPDHYRREKVHVVISVAVWFGLALVAGYAGLLRDAPAPAIPFVILVLSALVLFVFLRLPPFRDWAVQVELRWLVLLHVTRFIGFYFLYLAGRGEIPRAWADPAGIGDVAIAMRRAASFHRRGQTPHASADVERAWFDRYSSRYDWRHETRIEKRALDGVLA